jgi:hypothetical protein
MSNCGIELGDRARKRPVLDAVWPMAAAIPEHRHRLRWFNYTMAVLLIASIMPTL